MSGICGTVGLNGAAPDPDLLPAMIAVLESRGPDGADHWSDGAAALGHTLLATTPEACVERLPFRDEASGCVITADVRLDNRDELLASLAISSGAVVIGDGELILRAYLLWGEACLDRLLGDFAFAIWDPRHRRLFCARDHIGMRQLIYAHVPGKAFVFATEPQAVLLHRDVPRRINEERIADFLEGLEPLSFTSTFFEQVHRLPPAHALRLDETGLTTWRYWELRPGPELKLESDEAYASAFLQVFTEAVRCRLRSPGPVGSMLSGGMDSGAVVAVASRLLAAEGRGPLATFSAIGPSPRDCKETRSIHAALAMPGLAPHLVNHAELEPCLDELIRLTAESGNPFDLYMTLPRAVYLAAHRAGMKVVLDGVGGDSVLGPGTEIARQIRSGRWRRAWRNLRGDQRFWGPECPFWRELVRHVARAFLPVRIRRSKAAVERMKRRVRPDPDSLISPRFARETRLAERRDAFARTLPAGRFSPAMERANSIAHPNLAVARERYDRVAASCAVEPRDPFLDIRVVEFCLTLPGDQLLCEGWPKIVVRRAMSGLLPDAVRWRTGKEHLGWAFTQALLGRWPARREQIARQRPAIGRFVRNRYLESDGQTGTAAPISQNDIKISCLARWLDLHSDFT